MANTVLGGASALEVIVPTDYVSGTYGVARLDLTAALATPAADAAAALAAATAAEATATAAQADATQALAEVAAIAASIPTAIVYVSTPANLPAAVAGVRTLAARTEYFVTAEEIDLGTDRLVAGECSTIVGITPECTRIKTANVLPLITATDNVDLRTIALENTLGPCLAVDGGSALAEVTANLIAVNFTGKGDVVKFEDAAFVIVDRCAWLGCDGVGVALAGSVRGLAMSATASRGHTAGFTFVSVPNTATVDSRVRLLACNINTPAGGTGLAVDPAAVADESLVVLGCVFAGAGAATSGVGPSSAKAFFKLNLGLESTYPRAAYSIAGNVTGVAATQNVAFKLAGTTVERVSQLFTVATTNRATYVGTKTRIFLVIITSTLTTVAVNAVVELLIAVNGVVVPGYVAISTTQGPTGTRAESMCLQLILELAPGQYVEAWGRCTSGATTVTWTAGQVTITEIGG